MALDRWWVEAQAVTDEFAEQAPRLRHAVNGARPDYRVQVTTLCGVDAVTTAPVPGIPAPECPGCDRTWRTVEQIPQRDERLRSDSDGARVG